MKVEACSADPMSENSIEWNSIWAGVIVSLIVGLLFNLLGLSIGISLFNPVGDGLYSLTIGTVCWLIFTSLVSMYIGGWIASRFSHKQTYQSGALNGALTGAISTFIFLSVAATAAGVIVSNALNALQYSVSVASYVINESPSTVQKVAKHITQIAPELSDTIKKTLPDLEFVIKKINEKALTLLPDAGVKDKLGNTIPPEKIKSVLEEQINHYLNSLNEDSPPEEPKEKLKKTLVDMTGKTPEEVNQMIEEWGALYFEAQKELYQMIVDTSRELSKVVSFFALINFLIILCNLIAALAGGLYGVRSKLNNNTANASPNLNKPF